MKRWCAGLLIVLLGLAIVLSGCSSSHGAGNDSERAKLQEQIHGLVNQIRALNSENERLRREKQEMAQQLSAQYPTEKEEDIIATRKLAQLQVENERLTGEQNKLVQQLATAQRQLAEREGEREDLLRNLDALRQAFVREIARLQGDNERLAKEQAQLKDALERAQTQLSELGLSALSSQELEERARALQTELQNIQHEALQRKIESFRQSAALLETATCADAQAESVPECLEQKIALAVELTKRGSVTRAVGLYEQMLKDYPELAWRSERLAHTVTAAEIAWELGLLRESIARSTISDLTEQIATRLQIWQTYIEIYAASLYADDALWKLASLYSNGFRWSGSVHYDPAKAIERLKKILELPQIETTERLSDLWRAVTTTRTLTKVMVFEMLARGYEVALQNCQEALVWYERAIAETTDEQKKTDLTATVISLRAHCEE